METTLYAGNRHTSPACANNGRYTTYISGANHTPNTVQYHIADPSTRRRVHANKSVMYNVNFVALHSGDELELEDSVSGTPNSTARNAARGKLRTEVMEMSADAKHMFSDFSTRETGAGSFSVSSVTGFEKAPAVW